MKIKGSFLIESLIMVVVLSITLPITWQVIYQVNQTIKLSNDEYKASIEEIAYYYQMYKDISSFKKKLDNCCISTKTEVICYDIKNNRLRRRKKKFSSMRYYSTYITNLKQWNSCDCKLTNGLLVVKMKSFINEKEYIFRIN